MTAESEKQAGSRVLSSLYLKASLLSLAYCLVALGSLQTAVIRLKDCDWFWVPSQDYFLKVSASSCNRFVSSRSQTEISRLCFNTRRDLSCKEISGRKSFITQCCIKWMVLQKEVSIEMAKFISGPGALYLFVQKKPRTLLSAWFFFPLCVKHMRQYKRCIMGNIYILWLFLCKFWSFGLGSALGFDSVLSCLHPVYLSK